MARSTVIGPETRIAGALYGKDDLVVEGVVDGPVHGEAHVTIAHGATVNGDVRGREVTLGGALKHNVYGTNLVRLLATAELHGDIHAPRFAVEEGAIFEGQVRMARTAELHETVPKPPATPKVSESAAIRAIPPLPSPGRKRLVRKGT
jgi:cytoskeletal protein CcmA (bactofilin family)